MKALFISNDPTIFDETSATRARVRAYALSLGELHVLSRAHVKTATVVDGALTLHGVSGSKPLALLLLFMRARALVRTHAFDIVSAQDPFEHGLIAALAARRTSTRLHLQVHTDFLSSWFVRSGIYRSMRVHVPFLNRLRIRIADYVLPKAHGIRAVSKRIADSLVARYGVRIVALTVLPIAVASEAPPVVPLPPHTFAFAFMCSGRLEPEKRIEDLLMALGKIAQRYPSVGLVVVGEGSERARLETLAQKLGLSERVLFMGEQGGNAWGLMKSAHCFLQASAYEGYGRTLIEAALARVPIITTDVGLVGEVFRGYEEVLATPPGDTQNLAAHMTAIIGDHQLRRALVLNAEEAAKKHLARYADFPRLIREDLARTLTVERSA
ncbi:MAG: glycosyltransferase [Minisyncoccia bacterium]